MFRRAVPVLFYHFITLAVPDPLSVPPVRMPLGPGRYFMPWEAPRCLLHPTSFSLFKVGLKYCYHAA